MKAILLIDMPKKCYECPLCAEETIYDKKVFICKGYESEIENLDDKEDWCPLRPLPQKNIKDRDKTPTIDYETDITLADVYNRGWNDCIDYIEDGEV